MPDDELMDQLLKNAMAAETPQLTPAFDAHVMRSVRPRRLSPAGRMVIAVYMIAATVTAAWLMRDLPLATIAVAFAVGVPAAAGAGVYGRRLALGA